MQLTNAQKAYRFMAMEAEIVRSLLRNKDISDSTAFRKMNLARAFALQFFDPKTEPDAAIEVIVRRGVVTFSVSNPHTNE